MGLLILWIRHLHGGLTELISSRSNIIKGVVHFAAALSHIGWQCIDIAMGDLTNFFLLPHLLLLLPPILMDLKEFRGLRVRQWTGHLDMPRIEGGDVPVLEEGHPPHSQDHTGSWS